MIDAGKVGELRNVLVAEKQNVAFQNLTLVPAARLHIAATSTSHGLIVVTRSVKDMGRCEVRVCNPWE